MVSALMWGHPWYVINCLLHGLLNHNHEHHHHVLWYLTIQLILQSLHYIHNSLIMFMLCNNKYTNPDYKFLLLICFVSLKVDWTYNYLQVTEQLIRALCITGKSARPTSVPAGLFATTVNTSARGGGRILTASIIWACKYDMLCYWSAQ